MSVRPGAIELLKRNPQEVDWNEITGNPAAIDFIEQNEDRVTDWSGLAKNKNAERLIPKYINRIPSRVYPELCKFKSVICPDMKDF
jgi:hypothetical protein